MLYMKCMSWVSYYYLSFMRVIRYITSINLADPTLSGNDCNVKRLQEASHAVHNMYAIMYILGPAIYDRHRVTSCNSSGMGTNASWVWRINGVVHDVHVRIFKLQPATCARHMATSCNIELVVYENSETAVSALWEWHVNLLVHAKYYVILILRSGSCIYNTDATRNTSFCCIPS